jgi:hypothetical protein
VQVHGGGQAWKHRSIRTHSTTRTGHAACNIQHTACNIHTSCTTQQEASVLILPRAPDMRQEQAQLRRQNGDAHGPRQLSHRLEPSMRRLPCRVGYLAGWSTIPGAVWWDTHQPLCFDLSYPCDVLQHCSTSLSRCAKSIRWATHTRQRTRHGTALHEALMTRARDAPTARNGQRCAFRSAPLRDCAHCAAGAVWPVAAVCMGYILALAAALLRLALTHGQAPLRE